MKLFQKRYWWLVVLAIIGYGVMTFLCYCYIIITSQSDEAAYSSSGIIAFIGFLLTDLWGAIAVAHGYYIGHEPSPAEMSPVEYRCIHGCSSLKDRLSVGLMDFFGGFITPGRLATAFINMLICFGIAKLLSLIF